MKKVFKSISCFFIIFNFCLNCYSNLIINTAERTIVYNEKIIISYDKDELSPVLSELLKHQNTKLLLEAIALKLEKFEKTKQINIKIVISKNDKAKNFGGYCMDPKFEKPEDKTYKLNIYYDNLNAKIYRPIVFFLNGRYRMSYLEVPTYISFSHESEHALNLLEAIDSIEIREQSLESLKDIDNVKNVRSFLLKKIPVEEQLAKNCFECLDELSVILGSFHKTTLGPCFLGETIFMREHYKAINEQLHFWCWSHSLIKKPSLGPWRPNNEVKFDHNLACDVLSSLNLIKIETKKQKSIKLEIGKAFLVTNFNDIGDIILVKSKDNQFNLHNLFNFLNINEITDKTHLEKSQKPLDKNIYLIIDNSDCTAKSGNISTFTFANAKIAQKLFFSSNKTDRRIYSENLHIESISLPLNIEKLVDKGSVFSIEQGKIVKVGETIDLLFKPFKPGIKNEIIIEGARIQLRNVAADGNCGVWALLQALYPKQKFIRPTYFQKQDMQRFRAKAANYVPPLKLPQAQNPTGLRISMSAFCSSDLDHWLCTDDFRYFAQALGRPIGIIVYGDGYRIYDPNGNEIVYDNMLMFRMYLNQHPGMPILCLAGNHYQAVTAIEDQSLLTLPKK